MPEVPVAEPGATAVRPAAPEGWVPVERRWFGLDRATIVPALAVLVLLAVTVWLLPGLNSGIARNNPAEAGDVIQVGDVVTFVPEPGWNIVTGERQGRPGLGGAYATTAAVTANGAVLQIQADTFTGTPTQLLDQIKQTSSKLRGAGGYRVSGATTVVATGSGARGAAARFTGTTGTGLVAAFVFDGNGVEVIAVGPDTTDPATAAQVGAMIRSIRPVGQEGTS